ncbi:hypothetical protein HK102_001655 [Quaeritorhiza haematococci]|nr:hypothetical protein HK102_001655 [Quaeritorhiza haematococci]
MLGTAAAAAARSRSRTLAVNLQHQRRTEITYTAEARKLGIDYMQLTDPKAKQKFIPQPRGQIQDPASFLEAIGRGCIEVAEKFTSWDQLFTCSSEEMAGLGVPVKKRKYILHWREWFKRGRDPVELEIPKRQRKYLKRRKEVELLRMKKRGLA